MGSAVPNIGLPCIEPVKGRYAPEDRPGGPREVKRNGPDELRNRNRNRNGRKPFVL